MRDLGPVWGFPVNTCSLYCQTIMCNGNEYGLYFIIFPARTSANFTTIGFSPKTETVLGPVCKNIVHAVASSSYGDEFSSLRDESKHIV